MNKVTKIFILALFFNISFDAQSFVENKMFTNGSAFNTFSQLQQIDFNKIPVVNIKPEMKKIDSLLKVEEELDKLGVGHPYRFGCPINTNIWRSV